MDGPDEPPHDPPQGDRGVIPKNDGKRPLAEKGQKLTGPNHNDPTASDRHASQEQHNAVAAPEGYYNEAQGVNEETNRAPPSPTASEKEEMIFYLGNHRVNELGFDDDKRGTAKKKAFFSKFKPVATASKGAQPAADFGDGDDDDIATAYNTQNREKNDPSLKGLDEIGGDEYRANLGRRLAAEKAADENRRGKSFFADRGGYGGQRGGGPSHHGRGGFAVQDRPNQYSLRRQRSPVPVARRRNSFGGMDASTLPPPRPVDDAQHAAQMAVAKALRDEHNRLKSSRGRGKPFVPSGNFGKHIIASPRASTPLVKCAPFKTATKQPAASKPVATSPRPVPVAERIRPVSNDPVNRPPVSTTFDKNWSQFAGADLARRTTSKESLSSALAQRQGFAPSSTGNARQTAHQRVASSSSRGTGLNTQSANISEQVPDEEFNKIYDVSPRSRYRPSSSNFRTINPFSVQRAASGSSLGTDLNVTTASILEVPPTVPEEPEDEQEEVWDSDVIHGISLDTGYHRRTQSVPLVQPDLLSLCGSSVAATSPRGAAQELMELEDELPWMTQSSDLPDSDAIIAGFMMPPSFMDDPFEMGPTSGSDPALNASAVDMTLRSPAISSHGAEQPAETGHREVSVEERSRQIVYARDEMVALRECTDPELVASIVDNLSEEVRPLQAPTAGERFQALREQLGSSYSSGRDNQADRSSEPLPNPTTIGLCSTLYTPTRPFIPKTVKREQSIGYGAHTYGFSPFARPPAPISVKLEQIYGHSKRFDSSMFTTTRPFIPTVVEWEDSYGYRGPKTNHFKSETTPNRKAAPEPASAKTASGGLGQSRWASPPGADTASNPKAAPKPASAGKAPSGLAASRWASPAKRATASAAAPEAARGRQASGGIAQSRWVSPPRRANASHAIPAATITSGSVAGAGASPMPTRTFAGSEVLVGLVKAKKLGGLAESKYADNSPHDKKSKKSMAKPVAPVRAAPPPLTPTGGGPGNANRLHPQKPEPSRGGGRSSGPPATANVVHENVSPFQRRKERDRGRFTGGGANSVSPSPSGRPQPESSSPMRSPTRSKGLDNSGQDSSVAAAFTEADRSALADATNRSRANAVAAPIDCSPKPKLDVTLAGVAEFDPVPWQQTLLNDAQMTAIQQPPQPQHEVTRRPMGQQPVMPVAVLSPGPSQPVSTQDLGPLLMSTDSQFPAHTLTGHVWLPDLNAPGQVRRRRCLVRGTPWVDPVSATVRANIIFRETDGAYVKAFGTLDGPPADAEGNRWFADLFAAADDLSPDGDAISHGHSFIATRTIQPARVNILGHHRQLDNMRMSGSWPLPAAPTIAPPFPTLVGMVSGSPMNGAATSQMMNNGSFMPVGPVDRSHAQRLPNPAGPFVSFVAARSSPERPPRISQAIPIRLPGDIPSQTRTSSIRSSIATGSQSTTSISAQSSPFIPVPTSVGRPSAAIPIRFRAETRSSSSSPSIGGGGASRPSAAIPIRRPEDRVIASPALQASAAHRSPSPPMDTTLGLVNGIVNGIVSDRRDDINHSTAPRQAATPVRQPRGPAMENNFSALGHLPRDISPLSPSIQSMLFPPPPQRRPERVTWTP